MEAHLKQTSYMTSNDYPIMQVPEDYVEQTASGASVAVVTALLAAALVWSEARYFLSPGYNFKFVPDADYETKLTINVDITVAMPCDCE